MKTRCFLFMAVAVTMMAAGCGGSNTSSDRDSTRNVDIALLQVDGEFLVEGIVFEDTNGNGVQDSGEPGLAGVTVTLEGIDQTVTGSGGGYSLLVTEAGIYTVVETDPAGYLSTTPNSVQVEVVDQNVTVNFGDQLDPSVLSIAGTVFEDANMNGMLDSVESGIPDVSVTLVGFSEVLTNSEGHYRFTDVGPGVYTVVETDPQGYVSTTPNEVTVEVVDTDVVADFGDWITVEGEVDIKPGSDVNPLNLKSKGVLPVAVLGSAQVDVRQIDPDSLLLEGVPVLRWSYEDVAGPGDRESPDGYGDLTLKFSTPGIASALGVHQRGDIVTLTLTGLLSDGTIVTGEDVVRIVQVPK